MIVHITRVNKSAINAGTILNTSGENKVLNLLVLNFVFADPTGISICCRQLG